MLNRIRASSVIPPRDHKLDLLSERQDGGCDETLDGMHIQDNGGVSGINKAGPVPNMSCRNSVNSGSDMVVLPLNSDSQDSFVHPGFPESSNGVSFSRESSRTTVISSESLVSSVAEPLRVESTSSSCTAHSVCDGTPRVSLGHLSAVKNHERFSDTCSISPTSGEEEILESTLSNECESGDKERREDYAAKTEEIGEVLECSGDVSDGPGKPHHLKIKSAASVAKDVVNCGPPRSPDRARVGARSQDMGDLKQDVLPGGSMLNRDFSIDSVESTDNSLLALEQRVEEACALVERVLREREEREQFGREIDRKEQEIREQRARKKREREAREQEEASRWLPQRGAITGRSQWLCEHYQRHCRVRFPCCSHFYSCHRCHNNSKACDNKEAKASNATHLKCSFCELEQEVNVFFIIIV